jgi:hypothetical protein
VEKGQAGQYSSELKGKHLGEASTRIFPELAQVDAAEQL